MQRLPSGRIRGRRRQPRDVPLWQEAIIARTPIAGLLGIVPPTRKSHVAFRERGSGRLLAAIVYYPANTDENLAEEIFELVHGAGKSRPAFCVGSTRSIASARIRFEKRFGVKLADVSIEVHDPPIGAPSTLEKELRAIQTATGAPL